MLHDTTCRTRWLRQIVRVVVQVVLPAAVVLAVLGVTWIVWAAVGLGLLLALWYSLAYINSTAERRLVKHGYEPGTLMRALRERDHREHADQIVRYMQTYAIHADLSEGCVGAPGLEYQATPDRNDSASVHTSAHSDAAAVLRQCLPHLRQHVRHGSADPLLR